MTGYSDLVPRSCRPILVLTGAGISAESGIPTFRGADGLWEGHRIEDVASPAGFRRNPELVHRFYNARRAKLLSPEVRPNAGHQALVELARRWPAPVRVITQNVDDLHERAGLAPVDPESGRKVGPGIGEVLHMHGELRRVRHMRTGATQAWDGPCDEATVDPETGERGVLRPHIVWFGEAVLGLELIEEWLDDCEYFLAIGTQGAVWPAAGFVHEARRRCRARALEFNLVPTEISAAFDTTLTGRAGETLPKWVRSLVIE
ncbi:MAG: NAD-dependent deacylase [Phycisphaerae bacterium]|jgi:NAD-dependent deacetylase|nr:NAD-dependent deacylase [Phycisphaerae bacterium]